MPNKLLPLAEAIAAIPNGAVVALGGSTLHRSPSAAVHELIRQGKQGLHLIKVAGGYDIDLLCGAGAATTVTAAYVGLEAAFGAARCYWRSVDAGRVKADARDAHVIIAGLRAAVQGVPFMPVAGLIATGHDATADLRSVADPYSGQEVVVVPALLPDVAIIHTHEADAEGNARISGSPFEDALMAAAARYVIITAERIVDGSRMSMLPEMTSIAGLLVGAVSLAPCGAWPCSCIGRYEYDTAYLTTYQDATGDDQRFRRFLTDHVLQGSATDTNRIDFQHR